MNLKTLAKLVWRRALEKQAKGEIPVFLGVNGLLALMHKNIIDFYNVVNTNDEVAGDYILDLCVNSLFALQCVVPDIDDDETSDTEEEAEDSESMGEPSSEEPRGKREPVVDEEPSIEESSRFTQIPPGKSITDL